ncbi:MAG TPA: CBS domain-containing protein [Terriglobia bacterium]|nr:CBS domain-containing protein [Terriglobia bacterium]
MNMNVKEAMGTPYVTVRDTDSVLTGLKRLVKEGISGAPVISADSQLMGMVTEFDLLLAIDHVGEDFPISRLMHREVVSIRPEASLEEARELILTHNYRRLPVVENNKVIGVLSRRDLLRVRFGL